MQLTSRFSISLIAGIAAISMGFAFYRTRAQTLNMRRDLEQKALMLGDSQARTAEPLVAERRYEQLQRLVVRIKDREILAGVAAYDAAGMPLAATTGLDALLGRTPASVSRALHNGWASEEFLSRGWPIHVAAIPLRSGTTVTGALAIIHDTAYINTLITAMWAVATLGLAALAIAGITPWVRLRVEHPLRGMPASAPAVSRQRQTERV